MFGSVNRSGKFRVDLFQMKKKTDRPKKPKTEKLQRKRRERKRKTVILLDAIRHEKKSEISLRSASNPVNGSLNSAPTRQQTNPPSIPISDLFPDGNFPEGEIMEHPTPKNSSLDGLEKVFSVFDRKQVSVRLFFQIFGDESNDERRKTNVGHGANRNLSRTSSSGRMSSTNEEMGYELDRARHENDRHLVSSRRNKTRSFIKTGKTFFDKFHASLIDIFFFIFSNKILVKNSKT